MSYGLLPMLARTGQAFLAQRETGWLTRAVICQTLLAACQNKFGKLRLGKDTRGLPSQATTLFSLIASRISIASACSTQAPAKKFGAATSMQNIEMESTPIRGLEVSHRFKKKVSSSTLPPETSHCCREKTERSCGKDPCEKNTKVTMAILEQAVRPWLLEIV